MSGVSRRSPRFDLWLAVTAKSVSLFGDEVALLALTLRLQSEGARPSSVAALLMAGLLPFVLLVRPIGWLVDRYDSRVLLIGSSVVQAGLCALLAGQASTPAILALVLLLGIGQAINGATWQALLPAIVGTDDLPRALGFTRAAGTLASLVSPVVAGVLTGRYGARVPLLIDGGTFVVVGVAAALITARRGGAANVMGSRERGGLSVIRADPVLRPLIVLLTLFIGLGSMINVVDVFLVRQTLGASATWYGVTAAVLAAGALVGSLGAGQLRGQPRLARAFVGSSGILSISFLVVAVVPSIGWLLPVAALLGASNGMLNVALGALVMGRVRDAARGRVSAAVSAAASAAQIGAYLAGGALGSALMPRQVFLICGAMGLLAPIMFGRRVLRAADTETAAFNEQPSSGSVRRANRR